jgi:hypothetical protein
MSLLPILYYERVVDSIKDHRMFYQRNIFLKVFPMELPALAA